MQERVGSKGKHLCPALQTSKMPGEAQLRHSLCVNKGGGKACCGVVPPLF